MEELIDTINALAENIDSSINVERVLDGIQVMGKNYPMTLIFGSLHTQSLERQQFALGNVPSANVIPSARAFVG